MKAEKRGRAVIMAGGPISDYSFYTPQKDDYVICADSGYRHAEALGIIPDILLGDFDSIAEMPQEVEILRFPAEKDETDLQIAICHAREKGFSDIYVIGAFGGRLDHFLGNVCLLHWAQNQGADVIMQDADTLVRLVSEDVALPRKKQHYLSVIPFFGDATVSITGVKYPLEKHNMLAGDTLGISNEFKSDVAHISVHSGKVLVIECRADKIL